MKQIELKATVGDYVYFMDNNEIRISEIYGIEIYNNYTWIIFRKTEVRYKFWDSRRETFSKKYEDVFLTKEELIKSLGEEK